MDARLGSRENPMEEEPELCPRCGWRTIEYLRDDGPLTWYGCKNCTTTYAVDSTDHYVQTG